MMKRVIFGVLISTLVVGMLAVGAEAQRHRHHHHGHHHHGHHGHATPRQAPRSAQISTVMSAEHLHWGMSKDQAMHVFLQQVQKKFDPQIRHAPGAIEEDQIRHQMNEAERRIRDSYTEFNGGRSGWDVSFLQGEFTHNNHEAMFVVRDNKAQNFLFFINNRLWKWYRAFNASVFAGATFAQFAHALQGRYGPAVEKTGELYPGSGQKHWLEWQDAHTRLRAVDQTQFYGFYCLVFEDKDTLSHLSELRANAPQQHHHRHDLVDAVTENNGNGTTTDDDANIVDRLTGHIRHPQNAPNANNNGNNGNSGNSGNNNQNGDDNGQSEY